MSSKIYVVHCIDTEGPLFESLEATFERLDEIFHVKMEPSHENLRKLQEGQLDLDGIEDTTQEVFDPKLLTYNDDWGKIGEMLDEALSEEFRNHITDSNDNGWLYNWFCVDHVEYETNPRRRTIGYHEIFDHYRRRLESTDSQQDGLHFHFHPHPPRGQAHHSATHWWAHSNHLHQVLSRRIIDRNWFPAANRPGFHVNRPDSHWFLEQYIPFDFANQAVEISESEEEQFGVADGRFGDWRRAPKTWTPYHPHHDDYQSRGDCRRWIARCLNVGTRMRLLDEPEIRRGFREASDDKPVVLALTNHDFRDIRPDVDETRRKIQKVSSEFPDVDVVYSEAINAMRRALDLEKTAPELKAELEWLEDDVCRVHVVAEGDVFGPQPFLAYRTKGDEYYHDNFDFEEPFEEWTYTFDVSTFYASAIETVGFGVNSPSGVTEVVNIELESGEINKTTLNPQ